MSAVATVKYGNGRLANVGFTPLETTLCCFIFFIASFEQYINGLVGSYLKYVILFAIAVILFNSLKKRRVMELRWYTCFYYFWLMFKLIAVFWTSDLTVVRIHFISQFGMVVFLVTLCSFRPGERQLRAMLLSMALGSLAFCLASLFLSEPYASYQQRFVLTIGGVQPDPNNAAALALPAAAVSLYLMLMCQRFRDRLLCLGFVALSAYVVLMTGSRGNLLSLAALVVFVVLFQRRAAAWRRGVFLLAFVALGLFVIALIPADTYARLFEVDTYGDGSGRTELWAVVWRLFLENPIFGSGWGSTATYIDTATHNTFLSMLAEQGIVGTLFFVAPIAYVSVASIRRGEVLPLLLMICCAAPALTIDAINKRFFWDALILAIMLMETPVSLGFIPDVTKRQHGKSISHHAHKEGVVR